MTCAYVIDTAAIRTAIVAALGTVTCIVDGTDVEVTGYRTRPDVVNAYDAWPEFRAAVPVTRGIAETSWYAVCALPGADLQSAVDSGDALMTALADALMDLGRVERVEPVLIVVTDQPNAGVPGVRCEVTI
jgi:hypothetical protein